MKKKEKRRTIYEKEKMNIKHEKMMNNEKMKKFGFTRKILDDFHDFVSECVSLQRKINNPFWGLRKVTIFIGRETKTHILPTKINEKNR